MKQWIFDTKRRLYVDRFGDRLTDKEIREALDLYIESIQRGMAAQVALYTAGGITVAELFAFLDEEIAALHGASGSIAYGGLEQMDIRKWARINSKVIQESGYLAQFKGDLYAAQITGAPLSAEGIANRAGLYAEAAYSEYLNQTVERESDNGVILGRRICEADGASCDECVSAATEEFIPLDEIADIGSLQCVNNCRCEIEFSSHGIEFGAIAPFSGLLSEYSASVQ